MKTFMTMLKIEGKQHLRCPDLVIFGLAMPVLTLLFIGGIWGKNTVAGGYTMLEGSFASLITVGICATAFMGIPLTIADFREKKILKHFFVTPVSPVMILLVEAVICMLTSLLSAGVIAVVAVTVFGYRMQGNILVFILTYLLVLVSMFSLGILVASLCKNIKVANVATSCVYFPMLFLSGALIPFEIFPEKLQMAASILPLTQGIKLLKGCAMGLPVGNLFIPLLIMAASIIIGLGVSAKTFRWE